jgi:hypothetical protein
MSATSQKNQAKVNAKHYAKLLASIINGQATVTDATKIELGLNVRAQPQPWPIPSTSPVIEIEGVSGWVVSIRLKAATSNKRGTVGTLRGKPAGVSGATILSYVGPTPPSDPSAFKFEGSIGQTRAQIAFPTTLPAGTKVWITAFWFNGRKQSGPACAPISSNLLGSGDVLMAA